MTNKKTNEIYKFLIASVFGTMFFGMGAYSADAQVLTSLTVNPVTSSINAGEAVQLATEVFDENGLPYVDPGMTMIWATTDPMIADIDPNGLVTGLSAGSVTITSIATSGSGNEVAVGFAEVTVIDSAVPVLTFVNIAPAVASVESGTTLQFAAEAFDQNGVAFVDAGMTVSWSTTDPAIADVDQNGLVTGVSAGTTSITVVVTDSVSNIAIGTAEVVVTAAAPVPVCETGADTDNDSIISNLEILNYVLSWKSGLVSNLQILRAVIFWKVGAGC